MRSSARQTLNDVITFQGQGLHTGELVKVTIRPSDGKTGIIFRRLDLLNPPTNRSHDSAEPVKPLSLAGSSDAGAFDIAEISIEARVDGVVDTLLGTTLANAHGHRVATVEHLLAAMALVGIDDAIIDLDGPEIPILDGSANDFYALFTTAGLKASAHEMSNGYEYLVMTAPVRVSDADRYIEITPFEGCQMDVGIEFSAPAIGKQSINLDLNDLVVRTRLASARTFCELQSVETMRARGLCKGGNTENALVVDNDRLVDDMPLRDPQEFVLHKALDLVGDLHLLGLGWRGRIKAYKPGHDLNNQFARALLAATDCYQRETSTPQLSKLVGPETMAAAM